ncbi:Terpenoid synthase [Penicillium expansum]|uniref:Terpenoid synthase n=1 Tax=Penicillium expansum TaxID=27334 RepID=A0A0A2KHR8_PENEN|nr:Terpenoid synthase [Penicillium expansum]KGO43194.1 Terpenoid synthase [Penicillium expansum]KGO52374.1 Terpenoid synthase [Penicillium expansum]KGO66451.1 Terpenoid synthase [Penicillium expansum]
MLAWFDSLGRNPANREPLIKIPPSDPPPIDPSSLMSSLGYDPPNPTHATSKPPGNSHQERSVYLPDLFCSIMAAKPTINPNYSHVKSKGNPLIVNALQADDKYAAKLSEIDFAYLTAIWAPSCGEDAFQVLVDWSTWIFLFDDQFDEGHLKDNPIAAEEEIGKIIAIMNGTRCSVSMYEDPLGFIFQTVWDRIAKSASHATQQRLKDAHEDFFCGQLQQVRATGGLRIGPRDVDKYLELRRKNVGVYSAFACCEAILGIDLPQNVQTHPSLQELSYLSTEMVILKKELTTT